MSAPAEKPTKCCKCSRVMDDPEGWVEGLNNHMWCPACQPPGEPDEAPVDSAARAKWILEH